MNRLIGVLSLLLILGTAQAQDGFPLRAKYPKLVPISTADFHALDEVIVVDTRNKVEYDVIHVKGATNILVGDMKRPQLAALRSPGGAVPIVFYCNGVTCSKSYKAAEKARLWGFKNCFVYDAGVFDWAKTHPARAEFFGKTMTPEMVKSEIIPKSKLAEVSLKPAEFLAQANAGGWEFLDLRDRKEREEFQINVKGRKRLSMDRFVSFLEKGAFKGKKLLIVDNVGKQVRWLHYYLVRHPEQEFRFLAGGVRAWQKAGFDTKGKR